MKQDDANKTQERFEKGQALAKEVLTAIPKLYWCRSTERWYERLPRRWVIMTEKALVNPYLNYLTTKDHVEGFLFELREDRHNRLKYHPVRSFSDKWKDDNNIVNLATTEDWVKPVEGDPHWLFDLLLETVSSNRKPEQEHIEKCILWKYLNPGEHLLPALVLYGESGSGKGLLTERVIKTIFTTEHWMKLKDEKQLQNFNETQAEMAVLLFDECSFHTVEQNEFVKANVHNETTSIRAMYTPRTNSDVAIWYIFTDNQKDGRPPIKVSESTIDRRYSFIHTKVDWLNVLKDKLEVDRTTASNILSHDLRQNILENPTEVGKWLNHLIQKYPNLEKPQAFHGEDYAKACEIAGGVDEELFIDLFVTNKGKFDYITQQTLYDLYRERHAKEGSPNNRLMRKATVSANLETWLKTKKIPFEKKNVEVKGGFGRLDKEDDSKSDKIAMRTSRAMFVRIGYTGAYYPNEALFIDDSTEFIPSFGYKPRLKMARH